MKNVPLPTLSQSLCMDQALFPPLTAQEAATSTGVVGQPGWVHHYYSLSFPRVWWDVRDVDADLALVVCKAERMTCVLGGTEVGTSRQSRSPGHLRRGLTVPEFSFLSVEVTILPPHWLARRVR